MNRTKLRRSSPSSSSRLAGSLKRGSTAWVFSALVLLVLPPEGVAEVVQDTTTHAPSGAFRPPTPSGEHRQDASLDQLRHPEGYATVPLGSLGAVSVTGTGPTPAVFVAGLGSGGRIFTSLTETLEEDYTVHTVTLPGYGGTSAPPMPTAGSSFADRTWLGGVQAGLVEYIETQALDRPLLVTFYSDAANAAVHLASERPDLVGGLLLLTASPRFPLPESEATRGQMMDRFADQWFRTVTEIMWPSGMFSPDYYANDSAIAERAWWEVLQPTIPTAVRYTVEVWATDLIPVVARLTVPTIVLSPGFDEDFLRSPRGEQFRSRFHAGWDSALAAGATLEHRIVPNARFLIWKDQPDVVINALSELSATRQE